MDKLTNEMIRDLANRLGLEPALLKAVQVVEAAGRDGFWLTVDLKSSSKVTSCTRNFIKSSLTEI